MQAAETSNQNEICILMLLRLKNSHRSVHLLVFMNETTILGLQDKLRSKPIGSLKMFSIKNFWDFAITNLIIQRGLFGNMIFRIEVSLKTSKSDFKENMERSSKFEGIPIKPL